jgi:hypothetical protein
MLDVIANLRYNDIIEGIDERWLMDHGPLTQ